MYSTPIAHHITWGTYGTRLHGDSRGTVDRDHNEYGEPVIGFDQHRWYRETRELKHPVVRFEQTEMKLVESLVPSICERGGWELHACAGGPDHVHVLLDARNKADAKSVRRMLKRWLGQALCEQNPRPDGASWWAECGSAKYVFERDYFFAALEYVRKQRATPP